MLTIYKEKTLNSLDRNELSLKKYVMADGVDQNPNEEPIDRQEEKASEKKLII